MLSRENCSVSKGNYSGFDVTSDEALQSFLTGNGHQLDLTVISYRSLTGAIAHDIKDLNKK